MIHEGLTQERWCQFSVLEQWPILELLDLTIIDPKNKGGRLKELERLREFLKDYFLCGNQYKVLDDVFLHNYFFDFSYAAALERGL